ncbi:NifB/NifX family molybdenum-iron cluster-binding protein [Megalodesulfovibrio paquesii]
MASRRVLIPLAGEDVAPRFDATLAVLLAEVLDPADPAVPAVPAAPAVPAVPADQEIPAGAGVEGGMVASCETIVLPRASADELCEFILVHGVSAVVANGIPEDHYHYLRWKRVEVIDDVLGPAEEALQRFAAGTLQAGTILYPPQQGAAAVAGGEGGAA